MSEFKRVQPRRNMDETYELNAPNSIESTIARKLRPPHDSPPLESESSSYHEENPSLSASKESYEEPLAEMAINEEESLDEDADLELTFAKFKPRVLALETIFVPFLNDYEPVIGEPDPLVKPLRPDGKDEILGLEILDEPAIQESNPTVLWRQLEHTIIQSVKPSPLESKICHSAQDLHEFIADCEENFRRDQGTIAYSIPAPGDIILQLWPEEMQHILTSIDLPDPKINLSLTEYAQLCCLLLDIPTADNLIESMHMFFTNYQDIVSQMWEWEHH